MTKNEQVAKIIEETFGLKASKGTYERIKRTYEEREMNGVWAWRMKVDPTQFPPYGTPIEKCKCIKLYEMFFPRKYTGIEATDTLGLYDEYFDDRYADLMHVGSTLSLGEILDEVCFHGTKRLSLTYEDMDFEIHIQDNPVKYMGDYNKKAKELMTICREIEKRKEEDERQNKNGY